MVLVVSPIGVNILVVADDVQLTADSFNGIHLRMRTHSLHRIYVICSRSQYQREKWRRYSGASNRDHEQQALYLEETQQGARGIVSFEC